MSIALDIMHDTDAGIFTEHTNLYNIWDSTSAVNDDEQERMHTRLGRVTMAPLLRVNTSLLPCSSSRVSFRFVVGSRTKLSHETAGLTLDRC